MKNFIKALLCFSILMVTSALYASPPGSKVFIEKSDRSINIVQEMPDVSIDVQYVVQLESSAATYTFIQNPTGESKLPPTAIDVSYCDNRLCYCSANTTTENKILASLNKNGDKLLYLNSYNHKLANKFDANTGVTDQAHVAKKKVMVRKC